MQIWQERYVPDLSILCSPNGYLDISQLVEAASTTGRLKTLVQLKRLMQINCECAGIKTDALFSYIPNIVNLSEAQRLAQFVWQVYEKALEIYSQQLPLPSLLTPVPSTLVKVTDLFNDVFKQWAMPGVEQLAVAIEPVLQQLREQHLLAKDRRSIGFMTTQFHFSSELVLKRLALPEQVLLGPYFRFIEEQLCIPLQRVCKAGEKHRLDSLALAIVQQLLPVSREIASTVYSQATRLSPDHRSRRGYLSEPMVMASTIRDIQMFQGYLWLCLLEGSMEAMEKELLPLCVLVFPSVDVTWQLVEQMLQLLADELIARLEPDEVRLLLPYTQAMQQMFSQSAGKSINY